ncbi:MAG TPA: hypothetical protein DDW88_09920, partial [Treponema sp.]|nr:hypothetical protein [Treponema sp.]
FDAEDYLIYYKAAGLASAPLKKIQSEDLSKDFLDQGEADSALREVAKIYPEVLEVASQFKPIEGGLVHRIDTATSGLLLLAKNQKSYDFFIDIQKKTSFLKSYTAFSEKSSQKDVKKSLEAGYPPLPGEYRLEEARQLPEVQLPLKIASAFRNFGPRGASVRPLLIENAKDKKIYQMSVDALTHLGFAWKIEVSLSLAYRHQVRSHLHWLGYPIIADMRYGRESDSHRITETHKNPKKSQKPMLFFASGLSFIDPKTDKTVSYALFEEDLIEFARKECNSETR